MGPWTTARAETLIGADVVIQLSSPVTQTGVDFWVMDYDPAEGRPFPHYQRALYRGNFVAIQEIGVTVDLVTPRIAGFSLPIDDGEVYNEQPITPFPAPILSVTD